MNPLFHELFQMSRFLSKEVNQVLKEHDLFAAQWTVLFSIHKHGEMSLTEIWKYLNVEAPTITRTVNRLEDLGWLSVHQGKDRREKIVRLSNDAIMKFPEIETSIIRFENEFLEGLNDEEQLLLIALLKKMNKEGSL